MLKLARWNISLKYAIINSRKSERSKNGRNRFVLLSPPLLHFLLVSFSVFSRFLTFAFSGNVRSLFFNWLTFCIFWLTSMAGNFPTVFYRESSPLLLFFVCYFFHNSQTRSNIEQNETSTELQEVFY